MIYIFTFGLLSSFLFGFILFYSRKFRSSDFNFKTLGDEMGVNSYELYLGILMKQQKSAFIGAFLVSAFFALTVMILITKWQWYEGGWEAILGFSAAATELFAGTYFWRIYIKIDNRIAELLLKKLNN